MRTTKTLLYGAPVRWLCLLLVLLAACSGDAATTPDQPTAPTTGATEVADTDDDTGPVAALDQLPTPEASTTPTVQAPADVFGFGDEECAELLVDLGENAVALLSDVTLRCGYFVVPELHANPAGRTLRLGVVVIESPNPAAAPDPLVMAQGGPGGSTIGTYAPVFLFGLADEVLNERDVILFDQRGTGVSEPALDCPEVQAAVLSTLDQNLDLANRVRRDLVAFGDCRTRLVDDGINLAAYNSLENAADLAALPEALGYDSYNLYGVSYGSLLAQHVMQNHPENLRSVILDGVVPTSTNFIVEVAPNTQRSLDLLLATCAADLTCDADHPELKTELFDLVGQLNEQPVMMEIYDPTADLTYQAILNGDILLETLQQQLYIASSLPALPTQIYAVRDGDYTDLARARYLFEFVLPETISTGMYNSVVCAEDSDFTVEDIPANNIRPELRTVFDTSSFLELCALWQVRALDSSVDEPVVSEIPALLMSGEFDPITPPGYADTVGATLANATLVTFPGQSHGQFLVGDDCATRVALAFLNNPTAVPDQSCVGAMVGLQFGPVEIILEPFKDEQLGIEGVRPSAWSELNPGIYVASDGTATLVQLLAPSSISDLEAFLTAIGASNLQEAGEVQADGTWQLYTAESPDGLVDLALSEDRRGLVQLFSSPLQRDVLYDGVFLPAVDAFRTLD